MNSLVLAFSCILVWTTLIYHCKHSISTTISQHYHCNLILIRGTSSLLERICDRHQTVTIASSCKQWVNWILSWLKEFHWTAVRFPCSNTCTLLWIWIHCHHCNQQQAMIIRLYANEFHCDVSESIILLLLIMFLALRECITLFHLIMFRFRHPLVNFMLSGLWTILNSWITLIEIVIYARQQRVRTAKDGVVI